VEFWENPNQSGLQTVANTAKPTGVLNPIGYCDILSLNQQFSGIRARSLHFIAFSNGS
jgi:hypothetical protein